MSQVIPTQFWYSKARQWNKHNGTVTLTLNINSETTPTINLSSTASIFSVIEVLNVSTLRHFFAANFLQQYANVSAVAELQ